MHTLAQRQLIDIEVSQAPKCRATSMDLLDTEPFEGSALRAIGRGDELSGFEVLCKRKYIRICICWLPATHRRHAVLVVVLMRGAQTRPNKLPDKYGGKRRSEE